MICRLCGKPARWKLLSGGSKFQSQCCFTTLSATRGTMFYRSSVPVWTWFYTIMLVLNLAATPSGAFLARHLATDAETAWRMLGNIRQQFSAICRQASECLRGQPVYVENLRFLNVLSDKGRKTKFTHVVVVAVPGNAFAFVLPRRHPFYYRALLERLGVSREIVTYDYDFARIGGRLADFDVRLLERGQPDNEPREWGAFQSGRALAVYLVRSLRKWPIKMRRKYMQDYVNEFVFRFNFAQDKAMMFPLFITSLERVAYCDAAEARAKIERFGRRVSSRVSQ